MRLGICIQPSKSNLPMTCEEEAKFEPEYKWFLSRPHPYSSCPHQSTFFTPEGEKCHWSVTIWSRPKTMDWYMNTLSMPVTSWSYVLHASLIELRVKVSLICWTKNIPFTNLQDQYYMMPINYRTIIIGHYMPKLHMARS